MQYILPFQTVFNGIISFSVACDTINRIMIIITHMRFKKAKIAAGEKTLFPAPWYPISDWIALAFMALIFIVLIFMLSFSDYGLPMLLAPVWVLVMYIIFKLKNLPLVKNNHPSSM